MCRFDEQCMTPFDQASASCRCEWGGRGHDGLAISVKTTTADNLELWCAAHNRYEAEQHFGREFPMFVREERG